MSLKRLASFGGSEEPIAAAAAEVAETEVGGEGRRST